LTVLCHDLAAADIPPCWVAAVPSGLAGAFEIPSVARIMERNAAEYDRSGFTPARMAIAVGRTRLSGYAEITNTVTKGVSGVGCTFHASTSTQAAVSIGAITSRLTASRKKELARLLADEFAHVSDNR